MNAQRTDEELFERLVSRLKHLEDDTVKLKAGDLTHAGRVADQLRVLVIQTRTNEPLLLSLAKKHGDRLEYQTDAPPHLVKTTTLEETLNSLYQDKYEGTYLHTVRDLIKGIADKEGAHEDPVFTDDHIEMKSEEYLIGGYPPYVYQLITISKLVVYLGNKFTEKVRSHK